MNALVKTTGRALIGVAILLSPVMALAQLAFSPTNAPVILSTISNQTANVGQRLSFSILAADSDVPAQTLTFSLLGHPSGARVFTVRGTNGIVVWTPKREDAKTTNIFTVVVSDDGTPSLSATQSFQVVVTELVQGALGTLVLQAGEDGCLPIMLDSTEPITNINFTVVWPRGTLTNFTVQPLTPDICASNIQFLSPTQAQINLSVCPGRTLTFTQAVEVADLCFTAFAGQASHFVQLLIPEIAVTRLGGTVVTNRSASAGRLVVVGEQSMLEALFTPEHERRLFLYGRPGAVYQIDSTTNLDNPPAWTLACRVPMTGPAIVVCCTDVSTSTVFYRAFRYSDGPTNQPPLANAGPDQIIRTNVTTLLGSATDDGLPAGCMPLTFAWTNIGGPGSVTFSSRTSAVTSVTFNQAGVYGFRLSASDSQDTGTDDLTVTVEDSPCLLAGLDGWKGTVSTASGTPSSRPGSVEFTNCEIVLTEGDSFLVTASREFQLPAAASTLSIDYSQLSFDPATTNKIKDAFEIALVDAAGNPVTYTVADSRDSFFNISEGQLPALVQDVSLSMLNPQTSTVKLTLDSSALGTTARLIFRLINNDQDHSTAVRISDVRFETALSTAPSNPAPVFPSAPFIRAPIDFASLSDVSASMTGEYGRTSFHERTRTLYADLSVRNTGQYPVNGPLLVGIRNFSDPTIRVLDADGTTPDGIPFYNLTGQLMTGSLITDSLTLPRTIAFSNPNRIEFTYDLVILGQLNRAPVITSIPIIKAVADRLYNYPAAATDPDDDALTFSLSRAPSFLNINPTNGLLSGTPGTNSLGTHDVTLRVEDGHRGSAEQRYMLSVITTPPNRPPYFVSTPVTTAYITASNLTPFAASVTATGSPAPGLVNALAITNGDFLVTNPPGIGPLGDAWNELTLWAYDLTRDIAFPSPASIQSIEFARLTIGLTTASRWDGAPCVCPTMTDFVQIVGLPEIVTPQITELPPNFTTNLILNLLEFYSSSDLIRALTNGLGHARFFYSDDALIFFAHLELSGSYVPTAYAYDADAVDADGDPLTFSLSHSPPGMAIDPTTGLIRWSPTVAQIGPHNVTVQVSDGRGGTATQSYVVAVLPDPANHPPIIIGPAVTNAITGRPYTYDVEALDPDNDPLSYSLLRSPSGMAINSSNGVIVWPSPTSAPPVLKITSDFTTNSEGWMVNNGGTLAYVASGGNPGGHLEIADGALSPDFAVISPAKFQGNLMAFDGGTLSFDIKTVSHVEDACFDASLPVVIESGAGVATKVIPLSSHPDNWTTFSIPLAAASWGKDQSEWAAILSDVKRITLDIEFYCQPDTTAFDNFALVERPGPQVTVRADDGRGGFDTQNFVINVEPPPSTNVDLVIGNVDRSGLAVDGQSLAAAGTVSATVTNLGSDPITQPFDVLFFEDLNHNGAYEAGTDTLLGKATVSGPLAAGQSAMVSAAVAATVSFPDTFVWAIVDSGNAIAESNESNNVARNEVRCQYIPPVGQFNPVVKWAKTEFSVLPDSKQVMMTPCVADLNGDGVPDVVFTTYVSDYDRNGTLRAVNGRDGSELWAVTNLAYTLVGAGNLAVGDFDSDGFPEIIAVHESFRLIAFEHDGAFKWLGASVADAGNNSQWGGPSLADLDHDGTPEIVFGARVFNSTGTLRWDGTTNVGVGTGQNWRGSLSIVADLDLDGSPEIIAGKTALRADGSVYWNAPVIGDGFAGIGNFNADPFPEVVLVTSGNVYLLDHSGSIIWGPVPIRGGGPGGAPTIADFDGDGQPEIGVAGVRNYVVLRSDGTELWHFDTEDGSSGTTSATVLDLDGDGTPEIIYGDQRFLRIFHVGVSTALYTLPKSSGTAYEYPVVAGVNAGESAQIVAVANTTLGLGSQNGIYLIGDRDDTWLSTRRIWNQHSYHINNVNDDGTIPRYETNSWQSHNTYRLNLQTTPGGPLAAPDLAPSFVRVQPSGGNTVITARIGNGGEMLVEPGIKVSFFNGEPSAGGVMLGVGVTTNRIVPGSFEDVQLVLTNPSPADLWVFADRDQNGLMQVNECDEANNLYRAGLPGTGEIRGTVFNDLDGDGRRLIGNSTDGGELWAREDRVAVQSGDHPDVVTLSDGSLRMYYTGVLSVRTNAIVSARSMDKGITWQEEGVRLIGKIQSDGGSYLSEPKVVHLGNGDYRMYVREAVTVFPFTWEINSAVSPDGLNWTPESGSRIPRTFGSFQVGSPEVVILSNGTYRMYFSGSDLLATTGGNILSAVSTDGLNWTKENGIRVSAPSGDQLWAPSVASQANGRLRMYFTESILFTGAPGTLNTPRKIYSAISSNGLDWVKEPGVRIDGRTTNEFVYGSALVPLSDGRFRMYFTSWQTNEPTTRILSAVNFEEPTLSGWTVYLDLNHNSSRDAGEPFTVTDTNGNYSFVNLAAGNYVIVEEQQSGWVQTAPLNGTHALTLTNGQIATGTDFGNRQSVIPVTNHPPTLTSSPTTNAVVGQLFRYDATANDPDGDSSVFDLALKPVGMSIQPFNGVLVWIPTADQIGIQNVILRASDGHGGVAVQSFQVIVTAANHTPVITSHPTGPAVVGQPWQYQVRAQDADGDTILFGLGDHPAGVTINTNSGLVNWTPAPDDAGFQHVAISATDGRDTTTQFFDLPVVLNASNRPPQIASVPPRAVRLGDTYAYSVEASDPDGDPLTFGLPTKPAGMRLTNSQPSTPNSQLILWTPTPAQLGSNFAQLTVTDGRGFILTQSFSIFVLTQTTNHAPQIVSTPSFSAVAGTTYAYDARAVDSDNDAIFWSLDTHPSGMSIDPALGSLRWTPKLAQLGTNRVVVRVFDAQGASATQTYDVLVRAVNVPPQIVSSPPTLAVTNALYQYAVRVFDAESDMLTFTLTTAPTNLNFVFYNEDDSLGTNQTFTTGGDFALIEWTPTAAQLGTNRVVIHVQDASGGAADQDFNIVVTTNQNHPPVITSSPSSFASTNAPYQYQITATDADGDPLSFVLVSGPPGMVVNTNSGLLQWTPVQVGNYSASVAALDPKGAVSVQDFAITVLPQNQPPTITSAPVQTVNAGALYRYDVRASDPDGNPLTYSITGPAGVTIDQQGRVTWQTSVANAGIQRVNITVSDPFVEVTQSYDLAVLTDTTPPFVRIGRDQTNFLVGTLLDVPLVASDNGGPVTLEVFFNNIAQPIGANHLVTLLLNQVGTFTLRARATDAAGNVGTDSVDLNVLPRVVDPNAPVVALYFPTNNPTLTAITNVLGTAKDANLLYYTLEVALRNTDGFTEVWRGSNSVDAGVLGRLDPSTLANDSYTLRLTAVDAGGNSSSIETDFEVAGELKVGNFRLSFVDLSIAVNGIPVTVARTYDSLDANRLGDFGYGWRLEFRDARLRTSVGKRPPGFEEVVDEFGDVLGTQLFPYPAFRDGTRIYVTPPGGRREGFTFKLQPGSLAEQYIGLYRFTVVPDPGVTSQLSIPGATGQLLKYYDTGELFWFQGLRNFNPEDPGLGGSYLLSTKDGIAYTLDAASGFVTSIVDPNGNALAFSNNGITNVASGVGITFTRDPRGRIIAVTDPMGHAVRYQYNNITDDLAGVMDRATNTTQFAYSARRPHFLERVIDPLGRTGVRTGYDEQGRLTNLVDAAGNSVLLVHNPDQSIEQVVDALGRTNTFVYDERGNVVAEANALGGVTRRAYDANNYMTMEVDALGNTNRFTYDGDGNVLEHTDPLGNVTRNTYQEFRPSGLFASVRDPRPTKRLATTTDPLGNTTINSYDADANLAATTDAKGHVTRYAYDGAGNQTSISDASGNVTQFEYDGAGHLMKQTDALGNVTGFAYDGNGNQLSQTTIVTVAPGVLRTNVSRTDCDANGRPLAVTDALGNTTRTIYDALGNTAVTMDALGHTNRFVYDDRGQLLSTVFADGTSNRLAYDAAGRRTNSTDRAGRTTSYEYDLLGRLLATTYPDGTRTRTVYDLAGRVLAQFDERTNRTAFAYDPAGLQIAVTNALGFVTSGEYNSAGRRISDTDALGHVTRFVYDELGRRIRTLFADGTTNATVYDTLGRVAAEVDQAGVSNAFGYDALGRLTSVTNALGTTNQTVTVYAYNEAGNLLRQQDALNRITRYEYDGLGRRIASVLPLGQRSGTLYSPVGNVAALTNFNGQVISFDYDANNRLAVKTLPEGTVRYAYTPAGRRAAITNGTNVTVWTYDARDRLTSRTDPDGRGVAYAYDPAGNRTALFTTSNGQQITNRVTRFTFDALNRLETVTDPDGGVTRYTYDPANNVQFVALPNGTFRTNAYDALNRVTSIAHLGPTGVFSSFRYTLGPTGQRLGVQENTGRTVQYAYDPLYRLTRESITDAVAGNRTVDYALDSVGNRLVRMDSVEGRTDYSYDDNDQLLTETLGGTTTRYNYDFNGNTLSRSNNLEQASYNWSAENRLLAAAVNGTNGSHALAYQYDDDGIRVAAFVDGDETRYLIDANRSFAQVVEEYAPNGAVRAAYTHGPHHLISQSRAGTRSWYHADGLGSTRALTGQSGSPTDRYHFDAYGRTLAQSGPTDNAYLYAGEQRDRNLGLDYLRARYLSFNAGRFYGRDAFEGTLRTPHTRQSFLYVASSPINFTDPSGDFTLIELSLTVSIISDLRIAEARSLSKTLQSSITIADNVLKPARLMQDIGLTLLSEGVPGGFDLFVKGQQLEGQGYRQIGKALSDVYTDIAKDLVTLNFRINDSAVLALGANGIGLAGDLRRFVEDYGQFAIAMQKLLSDPSNRTASREAETIALGLKVLLPKTPRTHGELGAYLLGP